jgi:hypothetical protein
LDYSIYAPTFKLFNEGSVNHIFEHLLHKFFAGGVSMCRRNQLCGVGMMCFGLGLLVAGFFESVFFCGCIGVAMIIGGFAFFQKK